MLACIPNNCLNLGRVDDDDSKTNKLSAFMLSDIPTIMIYSFPDVDSKDTHYAKLTPHRLAITLP